MSLGKRLRCAGLLALGASAISLVASCGKSSQEWPDHLADQSEHFSYYTRPNDTEVCAGITSDLERQRALVLGYLKGIESGARIEYYKFRDDDDLRANGPCDHSDGYATQCQRDHRIWTSAVMHQHELIHAYMAPRGRTARFLEEGIAETLTCGLGNHPVAAITFDQLASWANDADPVALQDEASLLVAHLLELAGPEGYLTLREQLTADSSVQQIDAALTAVYGGSGEELYAASQNAAPGAGCTRLWECSGTPWDTGTTSYDYVSPCGLPSFTPFTVTEPSLFMGETMQLLGCDATSRSPALPLPLLGSSVVALAPGRYFLAVDGDPQHAPNPTPYPAQLLPLSSVVGPREACSDLHGFEAPLASAQLSFMPRTLLQGATGSVLLHWQDSSSTSLRKFAASTGQRLMFTAQCTDGVRLLACDGCDESTCQVLCDTTRNSATLDLPADLVLEVSADGGALDSPAQIETNFITSP